MPKVSLAHKERRRAHLLDCAEEVFLQLGYRAARMQDVMERAGVSRGGLYDYFANKQEMFAAVRARRDLDSLTRLDRLATGEAPVAPFVLAWTHADDVPDAQAMRWVTAMLEYELEESGNPTHRQSIDERFQRFLSALTAVLEAGVRRGEFEPVLSCRTVARFLIVAQDGAAMGRMVMGEGFREGGEYGEALGLFARTSLGIKRRERTRGSRSRGSTGDPRQATLR